MTDTKGTIFLPPQRVRPGRGVPGYKGKNIKVTPDGKAPTEKGKAKAPKSDDE